MLEKMEWQEKIHQEIPATKQLGLMIEHLDFQHIRIKAPLERNRNGHQTGFAGSIFTVGITTGWTLVSHYLQQLNIDASVVAGNADIQFKKPVTSDLVGTCHWPALITPVDIEALWKTNRSAKIPLTILIGDENSPAAKITATFYSKPKL